MDLVAGADNIIVTMTHASKHGDDPNCWPSARCHSRARAASDRVLTDLAFLDIADGKFILRERAPGVTVEEIIGLTDGELIVPDNVPEMVF